MKPERLEELRQLAGGVDAPKSLWMDELIWEVDRLNLQVEKLRAEVERYSRQVSGMVECEIRQNNELHSALLQLSETEKLRRSAEDEVKRLTGMLARNTQFECQLCRDGFTGHGHDAVKPNDDCLCASIMAGKLGCECPVHYAEVRRENEKRNDESNPCGVFVGGMGPCIAPIPCQVHPEKRPELARICTCTGQGHTDECELAHKR